MNPFQVVKDAYPLVTHIAQSGHFVEILKDSHEVFVSGGPLFESGTLSDPKKLAAAIAAMQKDGRLAHLEAALFDLAKSLTPVLSNPADIESMLAVVKDVGK